MKNRLKIAMYLRLSKEDDWNAQESNSISYQRLLLRGYIERNFENYEILEFEMMVTAEPVWTDLQCRNY